MFTRYNVFHNITSYVTIIHTHNYTHTHDALFDRGSVRGRLRLPPLNTNRHRDSFIRRAIKLYNSLDK